MIPALILDEKISNKIKYDVYFGDPYKLVVQYSSDSIKHIGKGFYVYSCTATIWEDNYFKKSYNEIPVKSILNFLINF